jgi:drug/metabolite transporter (DMT)-like permease
LADFRDNLRGIVFMLLGSGGYIVNDALVKLANSSLPFGEIVFIRGVFATLMISAILWATGQRSRPRLSDIAGWGVFLRTVGELAGTFFYLTALFRMPIGTLVAILQAVPVLTTAFSAIVLREAVGVRRWTAVFIGFAGVLIIVRPGIGGLDIYVIFAFAAMACVGLRDLATRYVPAGASTLTITLATSLAITALGLGFLPTETWLVPAARDLGLLALAASFILVGYFGAIAAMRVGDMSLVSPFRYSIVVWAILLGYVVWHEVPDAYTLIGTTIVVATGIYTVIRERKLAGEARR